MNDNYKCSIVHYDLDVIIEVSIQLLTLFDDIEFDRFIVTAGEVNNISIEKSY